MLKTVSLFSGCGGSDYGAKLAGADIIFANDNNPHAAATYRKYKTLLASEDTDFNTGDVRDVKSFPLCDLLIGCYPCQSFTMGGPRSPADDSRSELYKDFLRCLRQTQPRYFVAENVAGMKWLEGGRYLDAQLECFSGAGRGYRVSAAMLDAKTYGVPAERKRIFLVGVRNDLLAWYRFPPPSHGPLATGGQAFESHGRAIAALPDGACDDYYRLGTEEFSWWYMSRNRKRSWADPSHTIVANWRHVPLHPASPKLRLAESDLTRKSFQRWEFTDQYDLPSGVGCLPSPRRLSWRECSVLQTFPAEFQPVGPTSAKHWQVGNAVPPRLMRHIVGGLVNEASLVDERPPYATGKRFYRHVS